MTCINHDGERVLKGRHLDPCGSPDACPGCLPCAQNHCLLCRREHADISCPACVAETRELLARIVLLTDKLDDQARNGRGALAPHGIPGGDALVMQAPGANDRGRAAQLLHRLLFGLDVSHTTDERKADPNPPLAVLTHWEDRVRARLDQPTDLAPTMERAAAYLDRHLHEAACDLSFIPMARTFSATVRQLEDVLLDGVRPERSRVPCLECGTRLIKVYSDKLVDDYHLCPRCGERYDAGRYERAKHDHLVSEGADRYVYVAAAASAIGRPERTLRTWITRGQVASTRDAAGRLVAWWPDVRAQHLSATARSTRRNRDEAARPDAG